MMISHAQEYARLGWPVLPIHMVRDGRCGCGKADCASPGKHPVASMVPKGLTNATTDPTTVGNWWLKHPNANIGICTGPQSRIFVLDVDTAGLQVLPELVAAHGELPLTPTAKTGSGGRHYFFRYTAGLTNSKGALPNGIDVRGAGGYVVAPPSVHLKGAYQWLPDLSPDETPLADAPEWLLEMILGDRPAATNGHTNGHTPPRAEIPAGQPIPEGSRNQFLISEAGSLRRRGNGPATIEAALQIINRDRCRPPLPDEEVRRIAHSAARYTPPPTLEQLREMYLEPDLDLTAVTPQAAFLHHTDTGNAQRLCIYHGQDIRWVPEAGKWMVWDGRRWQLGANHLIEARAKDTAARIYTEAESIQDEDLQEALRKHASRSQSRKSVEAMIALGKSEPGIAMTLNQADLDLWAFNVQNGTLDLKTGQLRPFARTDYLTQMAPVVYDPKARCPKWLKFLDRILDGNVEIRQFLQRALGYCLTGITTEQIMLIFWGEGGNGKSTLIEVIRTLLGDYAKRAAADAFMVRHNDGGPRNDIAGMRGARLVSAVESSSSKTLDEGLVKTLTGDEAITARFLYGEFFEFQPRFKVLLATNHKPTIKGTDHGIWRRLRLVPFLVIIPESERDKNLTAQLLAELPGILNWCLAGCLEWQQHGLPIPEEVKQATADYREDQDHLGQFLAECCEVGPAFSVAKNELYSAYSRWAEEYNAHPYSAQRFSQVLQEKGFSVDRTRVEGKHPRIWRGLHLDPVTAGRSSLPDWRQ